MLSDLPELIPGLRSSCSSCWEVRWLEVGWGRLKWRLPESETVMPIGAGMLFTSTVAW